jgi:hypothetical protein
MCTSGVTDNLCHLQVEAGSLKATVEEAVVDPTGRFLLVTTSLTNKDTGLEENGYLAIVRLSGTDGEMGAVTFMEVRGRGSERFHHLHCVIQPGVRDTCSRLADDFCVPPLRIQLMR